MQNHQKKTQQTNVVPDELAHLVLEPLTKSEVYDLTNQFAADMRPERQNSLTRILIHLVEGDNFDLIREHLQPITGELGMLLDWE